MYTLHWDIYLCNHCWHAKGIIITYAECVFVALCPACGVRASYCLLASPALQCFSTLSHKWHDFRLGGDMEHEMCFDFLYQRLSETFFILWRTELDIVVNVRGPSGTVMATMLNFKETSNFPRRIFQKCSKIKFRGNSLGGSWVVPRRQTNRQTWRSWWSLFAIWRTLLKYF